MSMTTDVSTVFGQCTPNLNIHRQTTSRQQDFPQHVSFIGTGGPTSATTLGSIYTTPPSCETRAEANITAANVKTHTFLKPIASEFSRKA